MIYIYAVIKIDMLSDEGKNNYHNILKIDINEIIMTRKKRDRQVKSNLCDLMPVCRRRTRDVQKHQEET